MSKIQFSFRILASQVTGGLCAARLIIDFYRSFSETEFDYISLNFCYSFTVL